MDEVWELDGIFDEEDGGVVAYHVIVSFLSVVFEREATRVAVTVTCTFLTCNSGEPEEDRGALSNSIHEFGLRVLRKIVRHLDISMSTGALGVDNTLRDALSIEVGQLINKIEVL